MTGKEYARLHMSAGGVIPTMAPASQAPGTLINGKLAYPAYVSGYQTQYAKPASLDPQPVQTVTNPYNADFTGGLLSGPGTAEQWYAQHSGQFPATTNAQNYWNGVQGMFNSRYTTPALDSAYNSFSQSMGTQGQGAMNAYGIAGQLQTPGQGEAAARAASNYFGQAGTGENYMTGLMNSGFFQQPGQGEQWQQQNGGQFLTPGVAESNYGRATNALGQINYGQQGINTINNGLSRAQNAQNFNSQNQDFVYGASPIGQEYNNYFAQGLRGKSYSERMMDSGTGGLIDPYARAEQKQMKVLNDAAAARGMFGSGAAMRQEEELGADTAAAEANARIALAQQADQAAIARANQALGFSSANAADLVARRNLGLQAAASADTSQRGNLGLNLQAYNQASQEGLAKVGLGTQAATAAEQAQIDRLFKGGSLAMSAQDAALARTMGGANVANMNETLGLNRNADLLNAGVQGQQLATNRLTAAGNLGISADQVNQDRIKALFGGGVDYNNAQLGAYNANLNTAATGIQAANMADTSNRANIQDQFGMAKDVQNLYQDRLRGGQQDILSAATAQANIAINALDAADQEQFNAKIADIQAQVTNGQISAAYAQQQIAQIGQAAAALAKAKGK